MNKEKIRGCGHRKINGTYLVSDPGTNINCIALPHNVISCPCCFEGIKFSRGYKWFIPNRLFHNIEEDCSSVIHNSCAMNKTCPLRTKEKSGILWVGETFYTTDDFVKEAEQLGISKRIAAVPHNFEIGKTWVFLAHRTAGRDPENGKKVPAIFYVFKPIRIEKIVTVTQYKDREEMDKLRSRGITPVVVDDDDYDHRGSAYNRIHTQRSLFE